MRAEQPSLRQLLPEWVSAAYRWGPADLRSQPTGARDDEDWDDMASRTRVPLAEWLAARASTALDGNGTGRARARNWLHAWLCHELLSEKRPDNERRSAAIALVLQERIRSEVGGRRTALRSRERDYQKALLELLVWHAETLGLPEQVNLRIQLSKVCERGHQHCHAFESEYFRHASDVYLFGQFLLNVYLGHTEATLPAKDTIADKLSAACDDLSGEELRQAYALAALFHDAGVLLSPPAVLPHWKMQRAEWSSDAFAKALWTGVDESAARVGSTAMAKLDADLDAFIGRERYANLRSWLDGQCASDGRQGEQDPPDHALVGAAFVRSFESRVPSKPVAEHAVRAILLHNCMTQAIDPRTDPSASLLVLSDELLPWVPQLGPGTETPQFERRREPVFWVSGLRIEADEGRLVACLRRGEAETWPEFTITCSEDRLRHTRSTGVWAARAQNLTRLIDWSGIGWAPRIIARVHLSERDPNHGDFCFRWAVRSLDHKFEFMAEFGSLLSTDGDVEQLDMTGVRDWGGDVRKDQVEVTKAINGRIGDHLGRAQPPNGTPPSRTPPDRAEESAE